MPGNPNYPNTILHIRGSGNDGANLFTDLSPAPKSVVAHGAARSVAGGNPFDSSGTSLLLDGGSGTGLGVADHADFHFGASVPFCIQSWVKLLAAPSIEATLWGRGVYGVNSDYYLLVNSERKAFVYLGSSASTLVGATPITLGSWTHVALTRDDAHVLRLFINGVKDAQATTTASTESNATGEYIVGADSALAYMRLFANVFDLHIARGVSVYTDNFTPPSAPIPNWMGQVGGVVRDAANVPCARTVRLINRSSSALLAEGVSDASTGVYLLNSPTLSECQRIVLDDSAGTLENDLIDRVFPG